MLCAARSLLVLSAAVWLLPAMVRADGGTVRAQQRHGDYRVTIFTDPSPLRAGPVDVSVLVQDAETGTPLVDREVQVEVCPRDLPRQIMRDEATRAEATNKLFRAAKFKLPQAGWWTITAKVELPSEKSFTTCDVEAAAALPPWQAIWPWYTWPLMVTAAFVARLCWGNRKV